jgi:hypothetical protein
MSMNKAIAKAFGVTLPKEVDQFLAKNEEGRTLELVDGFVRGTFSCDFGADELADIEELAESQFIDEGDTLADEWKETFGSLVPLAVLDDVEAEDDDEPYKGFLAVDVGKPSAPVFLWDYDGWYCYLLADSFKNFLAGKAAGEDLDPETIDTSIKDRDKLGTPYQSIAWK